MPETCVRYKFADLSLAMREVLKVQAVQSTPDQVRGQFKRFPSDRHSKSGERSHRSFDAPLGKCRHFDT